MSVYKEVIYFLVQTVEATLNISSRDVTNIEFNPANCSDSCFSAI